MRSLLPATAALSVAVVASLASPAAATLLVNTGFEEGSFAATGLTDFSNITTPALSAGAGTGGSTALDFGSDGAAAGGSRTIDALTYFSMFGKYTGSAGTSNGTMSFGWTQAAADFNPYSGAGTGVAATDTVIVAVARDAGNSFRLAAVNGTHGSINSSNNTLFGTSAAALTSGNWYRLEGTIGFNAATKAFTFTNVSLDDFGATGTTQVTADVLSGTGVSLTAPTFGTAARPVFLTNRDRGFQLTDNYVADTVVPEPASAGLLAVGAVSLLAGRRRRR